MRKLILAAAALAIVTAPGLALAKNYDCTKPGNANKAQCKAAVAAGAADTTTVGAKPAAILTTATPAKVHGKPATALTTTVTTAKGGTMKACATHRHPEGRLQDPGHHDEEQEGRQAVRLQRLHRRVHEEEISLAPS